MLAPLIIELHTLSCRAENREMFIHDQRNAIVKGTKQGLEQGRKEGIQEGRKEGIQEGRKEGIQEAKFEIALRLLAVLDDETIAQMTALTAAQVQQLRIDRAN
jgi:predicted transposase/invertase (TIGR01784 family)